MGSNQFCFCHKKLDCLTRTSSQSWQLTNGKLCDTIVPLLSIIWILLSMIRIFTSCIDIFQGQLKYFIDIRNCLECIFLTGGGGGGGGGVKR